MKVTFTCEKCGKVLREYEPVVNDFYIYQNVKDYACPNCSKLTYGPLTEEMMAEALDDIQHGSGEYDVEVARFLLRLVKAYNEGDAPTSLESPNYVRDWLLDLARKP